MIENKKTDLVRIGMVNYINTAPIYEPWKRRGNEPGWHIVEAPPAILNKQLASGELDLGFVSCFEYGAHPELYRILPDLSISSNGPVGSVFLFSRVPLEELGGQTVLLTNQSETSIALTKVVLEEFFQVTPQYISGDVATQASDFQAMLAIGDDALRLANDEHFPVQLDLSEVWKDKTGLPFVFAVCAVREKFCREKSEVLHSVYQRLVECRQEGETRLKDICQIAAPRIPMEVSDCFTYLSGIEYDLGEKKLEALETFFGLLMKREDIPETALPLKIHLTG